MQNASMSPEVPAACLCAFVKPVEWLEWLTAKSWGSVDGEEVEGVVVRADSAGALVTVSGLDPVRELARPDGSVFIVMTCGLRWRHRSRRRAKFRWWRNRHRSWISGNRLSSWLSHPCSILGNMSTIELPDDVAAALAEAAKEWGVR